MDELNNKEDLVEIKSEDENVKIEKKEEKNKKAKKEKINKIEKNEENKKERKANWEKIREFAFNFAIVITLFLIAASVTPKTFQNDTFYNIKVGEWIYENGISDLTKDMHSWHDLPYTYPHWLYDLGIFVIYNAFGYAGIYVSTMIIYGLIGVCSYIFTKNKSKNSVIAAIVSIFIVYMMETYMAARAQSVTFILFILEVMFIERFLETHKKRNLIPLVIIPLLITNLHCAVFPFYFVLFLPYLAEYIIASIVDLDLDRKFLILVNKVLLKICKKEKEDVIKTRIDKLKLGIVEIKRKRATLRENPYKIKVTKDKAMILLVITMLIAVFTGLLNPAGTGAYTYLVKTLQGNTTESINEHLPVYITESQEFLIALVVALCVLIFTDTKIKLPDLFMAAGLTYLALDSRRQISMFILFCLPIIAKMIAALLKKYDQDKLTNWIFRFCTDIFGVIIVLSLAVIVSIKGIKPRINDEYINSSSYPVEATEWIKENLDYKNIKLYNEYNYGSYLLLNDVPVFIDSRCDLYTPEFNSGYESSASGKDIFSDAINIAGQGIDYEAKFTEYGVTHVMLYADAKLAGALETDKNYKLLYSDNGFKIFERLNVDETSVIKVK